MSRREWVPVTKRSPCPACGRGEGCAWAQSGHLKCRRTSEPPPGMQLVSVKDTGGIFRYMDDRPQKMPMKPRAKAGRTFDGQKENTEFTKALAPEKRQALASELGVADVALAAIDCGWSSKADLIRLGAWGQGWKQRPDGCYTFPEHDAAGIIVGFSLRAPNGDKGAFASQNGAHRGIVVPNGLERMPDPVLCVEGASDVAACLTMGIAAVGRPSNASGTECLAGLLEGRHAIVVGENDRKTHGRWPGREGAKGIASGLSEAWGRNVAWKLPPEDAKDTRAWLQQRIADGLDFDDEPACREAGRAFLEVLRDDPHSIPAPIEGGRARNESGFVPITELGPIEQTDWVMDGYIARGHITLLSAAPKIGKTTFTSHLLRDLQRGTGLVQSALGAPVLVISEETATLWKRRREALGLCELNRIWIRPFLTRSTPAQWEDLVAQVALDVRRTAAGLVVFDTLANLWWVRNENDSSEVGSAVMPLRAVSDAGAALLLIHHTRKSDGSEGTASRGSSALPGMVDIVAEMRRTHPQNLMDPRRTITSYSRFHETEIEGVFELGPDGHRFLGDKSAVAREQRLETLRGILKASAEPLTTEQVLERWPTALKPSESAIRDDLKDGAGRGEWNQTGKGRKGSPHRYSTPTEFVSSKVPPLRGRNESDALDEPRGEVA